MTRLLLCATALAANIAMAASPAPAGPVELSLTLEPAKIHEECARLKPGESRRYQWKSDMPVDFNIHYHRGSDVFYPVKRDATRGDGGTFTAKADDDYCWMWSGREKPARIEGRIEGR